MKKYLSFVFAFSLSVLLSHGLFAQKGLLKKANEYYRLKAYSKAIPYYESALKKDSSRTDALVKLADSYRLTNQVIKARKYYARVVTKPAVDPVNIYYYAQTLMQTGNYDEAETYMKKYRSDKRGKTFEEAIGKLSRFYRDTSYYKVKPVVFNSKQNDFSPVILKSDVIFVSARNRTQLVGYTHAWTNLKFYDIFKTTRNDDGSYSKPVLFARNLQGKYNDGPICFDRTGSDIFITRNNVEKGKVVKSSTGSVNLKIYKADLNEKKKRFENAEGFMFNSDEYNTAHPAISPDGNRLYFSSNMPGTLGGMDLWVCQRIGERWSGPMNLGDKVNTAGDEVFPYVVDGNTLCFASNGLEGIGGLDLFTVKLLENGKPASLPKNMGAPLNSPADDFGLVYYMTGKGGLFSSNRKSYDLDDDIYEFFVNKPSSFPYQILVKDSITKKLISSELIIKGTLDDQPLKMTEPSGSYTAELSPDDDYRLSATARDYKPKNNISFTPPDDPSEVFEILLAPVEKYFISGTIYQLFDDSSKRPLDSAVVTITDKNGTVVCTSYITDATGKYRSCDLKPDTPYTVSVKRAGFFAQSAEVPFIPRGGAIRDFFLQQIVLGKAIKIDNIYFDLDKSFIRPDAAKELDKIVDLLNENPDIIIELSSHTDCRASYAYNMGLSDRRAKSSAAYIVSKGIDAKRITGKGYGETKLVNDCKCEGGVRSDCSEEEHQLNRRTEFKVTGFVKGMGNVNVKSSGNF